jgi:hypothetical protein
VRRDGGGQVANDARVDVEEVVARHPGLPRDARGDQDDVRAVERRAELRIADEAVDARGAFDVRDVRGDALRERRDVEEAEARHHRMALHEERQRLADPARGAEDRDGEPAGGGG